MTPSFSLYPFPTPCGQLALGAFGDELCLCDWTESRRHARNLQRLRQAFGVQEEIRRAPVIERGGPGAMPAAWRPSGFCFNWSGNLAAIAYICPR